jgi:hypothetical protein
VFATATNPNDVLYLNETDTVAVAGGGGDNADLGIYFFQVDDYEHRGTLEGGDAEFESIGDQRYSVLFGDQYNDEIGVGEPKSMCKGEGEGEILVTTENNFVVRICTPNTACDASVRTTILLSAGERQDNACPNNQGTYGKLGGIAKVEDTYLVVDQHTAGTGVVYQCPIGRRCQRSERRKKMRSRTMCTPSRD